MSDYQDEPDNLSETENGSPNSSDDPVENALYTSFMQAEATGADASQAFNVGIYAAKQVALEHGIPEMVYEQLASDLFAPYTAALNEGQTPQQALRAALESLEG
jgi:hypothetical protein